MPIFAEVPAAEAPAETSVDLLREFERTGRPEPFEAFMRRHASMVYATCLKVTRDPHDAEDATQATFLTLASKSRLNGEIRQPEAWLRKVAHRLSLDLIRSKKRRVNRENLRSEMNAEAAPLDSHDHADKGEIKGILNEELAKLPASYRMPLILHYFGGLSRDEMAEQLKLKPSTLGVRLHRAREQLRRKLAARGILLPSVALTALLTEVVHQSVCGHMMSSTAQQASAIAMGHAALNTTAPMFAASTGVDSIGSLLSILAHGKFKVLLSALVVGTAISLGSAEVRAQIRALVPAALRSMLPSWRMPNFSLPRFEFDVPTPRLAAVTPDDHAQEAVAQTSHTGGGLGAGRVLVTSLVSSVQAAERATTASSDVVAGAGQSKPNGRGVSVDVAPTPAAPAAPRVFAFTTPTRLSTAEAFSKAGVGGSRQTQSAGPGRDDEVVRTASRAPVAGGDLWNGVIVDGGGGGSGGGGGPPPRSFANTAQAATADSPKRDTRGVGGAVPALQDASGRVAGDRAASAGARTKPSKTDPQAAAMPAVAEPFTETTQTVLFNGTGINHGGYATDSWKPTELNAVSSLSPSGAPAALAGEELTDYSFNSPAVPGTKLGVNGARATIHAAAGLAETPASIQYVDSAATRIPALPSGHSFIGVWQLDVATSFDAIDLLVHYDDLRAQRLGLNEEILKLWVSDGEKWSLLWRDPTFGRDVDQNLMWVTAGGGVKFFAASAPEPATLAVIIGAIGMASRRRR